MTDPTDLDRIIAELADALGFVSRIDRLSDGSWAVATDRGRVVMIDLMPDDGKLMLSALLGAPEARHSAAVHLALLSYNAAWQDTGGVAMAVGGGGGQVMQTFPLGLAGLDGERLAATIENFVTKADIWADYIARGPRTGEAPADAGAADAWIRA